MNRVEMERAEYLHRAFTKIAARADAGGGIVCLLRQLARRPSRHVPRGKYSAGNIINLYYKWKKAPSPLSLTRHYRGATRQVPNSLLLEFVNRIIQSEVISAHAAFDSLRVDWRRGVPLPGLRPWNREEFSRWAPRFPFSRTTFYSYLSGTEGRRFQQIASAAVNGQRAVRRLEAFLDEKRARFAEASKHERIAYTPDALRDARAEKSGNRAALPLSEADQHALIARSLNGSLSQAWRASVAAGTLSADTMDRYAKAPSSKSYVPQRIRNLITPSVNMLEAIHHGPRQARLKGAFISRDWSDISPGAWYSADDTTLPLYYWEDDETGQPRTMRGQCLVMNDCRTGRILAFALHSERNYTAKVIRGLILKTHDSYGLPRDGFFFERGAEAYGLGAHCAR